MVAHSFEWVRFELSSITLEQHYVHVMEDCGQSKQKKLKYIYFLICQWIIILSVEYVTRLTWRTANRTCSETYVTVFNYTKCTFHFSSICSRASAYGDGFPGVGLLQPAAAFIEAGSQASSIGREYKAPAAGSAFPARENPSPFRQQRCPKQGKRFSCPVHRPGAAILKRLICSNWIG